MTTLVDTGNLHDATGLAFLAMKGSGALRILVMAMVLSVILAIMEVRRHREALAQFREARVFSPLALAGNLGAFIAFAYTSLDLFNPRTAPGSHDLLTVLCVVSGFATLVTASLVFVQGVMWRRMFGLAPFAPVFGLLLTMAITALTAAARPVWTPWMRLTYKVVLAGLHLLCSNVVADAGNFLLGTTRFSVVIAPECSGYEGMALMLVFGSAWLWFFRHEFRFPQVLALLPAGVAAIWALNCVRILALILIGDAGAPAVAAGGFHSEAGWISFIILAAVLLLASQRIPWILRDPHLQAAGPRTLKENETAAYLIPFLSILAAGMVAHAASSSFEWLYPLRVITAAAAIWWFRQAYTGVRWRIGWESAATGILVFAIWIGGERILGPGGADRSVPVEWITAPGPIRLGWLAFRVLGAVVTVPIAEELAFRGYALRRLESADFTGIDPRRFTWMPLAISAVLFGVLHGRRWIAGTIAGVLYATVLRKRGSLGDAAAAHSVTNALLAVWVLWTGDWSLW